MLLPIGSTFCVFFAQFFYFFRKLRKWLERIMILILLTLLIPLIHFPSLLSSIQNVLLLVYLVILILFAFPIGKKIVSSFLIFFSNGLTSWLLKLFVVIRFHLQNVWYEWNICKLASYIRICGGFRYVVRRFFLANRVVETLQIFSRASIWIRALLASGTVLWM